MKLQHFLLCPLILAFCGVVQPLWAVGSWTTLSNAAPGDTTLTVLMTDGSVLAYNSLDSQTWHRLTPDIHGSYLYGTWSTNVAPMIYPRGGFGSQVLTNGQLFVCGGEFLTSNTAEVYDPLANVWTDVTPPDSVQSNKIFDSLTILLTDGRVLIAPVFPNYIGGTIIYDPGQNSWLLGPPVQTSSLDEASWLMLPDGSVLVLESLGGTTNSLSQRYIPFATAWFDDSAPPANLYSFNQELGPCFLLPNGKAIFFGATTTNFIYTPSGSTAPGNWMRAADFPNGQSMPDAPGAMMCNGKILLATSLMPYSNSSGTNGSPAPTSFYEYDYSAGAGGAFTQVPPPVSNNNPSQFYHMLALPDGNVLLSDGTTKLYIYQPDGSPITAGKPAIASVSLNGDGSLHLTGTLFNGISVGASFGDDWQEDSNYPLVRFIDALGNVRYGRTYHWSGGVATGSKVVSTDCSVPPGASLSDAIQVVVNGNPSDSVPLSYALNGITWVDFNYAGGGNNGLFSTPYSSMTAGQIGAASGGLVKVKAGSDNETLILNKRMRIEAFNGWVHIGP